MTSAEIIKKLREDGWIEQRRRGTTHRQFKHSVKPGRVTVAEHKGKDIPFDTLKSIEKQSRLKFS